MAAKTWRHPFSGLEVRFGVSTIERWLYAAKKAGDPVQALRNQVRRDIGRFPSLSVEAVQALTTQSREHPGWTAQLHHDNLQVTLGTAGTKCPSYPSVRRYLKAQGLLRRRPPKQLTDGAIAARDRLEQREVRSYEVEHVLQLLHLDFHHGSRKVLTRRGEYVKPCWSASSTTARGSCAMPSGTRMSVPKSSSTACVRRCRRWGYRVR